MTRWRLTAEQLANLIEAQGTTDRTVARGKRLTGADAEAAFSAEMDPKPTLVYDKIVDTTGCAIPQAAGKYPKVCPWCKREMP